ncbi:uncharacterized protein LOC110464883 [Mizuhopecten yessoensis]|uniref:Uncharacterized protein n=1 Tax=Mizuhopecten yessoensis TaxID=6573 RepID=A0A210PT03_MIZYE|nr:uncharacterized protein LOC110464883 [Mizuhopecten yessoensis]XP_021376013.1 uncharacterized protein LOC110464883 [Mizuhopecten yessoensis]XP_021376015.1 uncharacterized protein LOC110464883 [Mizuhopecten yessoensis]OWF39584.1 hypothetical protein KP79_PYT03968 [Mizuhopecten yessoensis]
MADIGHSGYRIALILLTCLVLGVTLFFNYLGSGQAGKDLGIYESDTGDISDYFYLEITPAGWTFTIWAFIYVWQIIWLIYGLSTICRKTDSGIYIYQLPVMPPAIYIVYILNLGFNIAWMLLFDRKYIEIALADIILMALTLYAILIISSRAVRKNLSVLIKDGAGKEAWFIRFFLHNGIAFYVTWVTVATHLNVAMVMHYSAGVANDISCTIALGMLTFFVMLWFVTENVLLDAYTRYLFSPYIVLVVALIGSIAKNFDLELRYRNSILSVILLSMSGFFLFLKLIIIIVRHNRAPLSPTVYSPTTSEKSTKSAA